MGPFSAKTTNRKKAQRELDKLLGKRARGEIVHAKRTKRRSETCSAMISRMRTSDWNQLDYSLGNRGERAASSREAPYRPL